MGFNFIAVSGFGWSGASAFVDLLKEFNGIGGIETNQVRKWSGGIEFRMPKDPHGLIDLESALIDNWEFIRHDIAIKDFRNYVAMLSRDTGLLKKNGKALSRKLFVDLIGETNVFLEKITDFTYSGNTHVHRYYLSNIMSIAAKIKSKFNIVNSNQMTMARPDQEKFIKEVRNYTRNIFNNFSVKNELNSIVLYQSIPPTNFIKSMRYFDPIKLIIVDRDPRDVYVDLVNSKVLIGADVSDKKEFVDKYILWHKITRSNSDAHHENVLRLTFEELVNDYNDTVDKVVDFTDINTTHSRKKSIFDPSNSSRNIGKWKSFHDQNAITTIQNEIPFEYI